MPIEQAQQNDARGFIKSYVKYYSVHSAFDCKERNPCSCSFIVLGILD